MNIDTVTTLSKFGEELDTLIIKLNALTVLDEGQKLSIYDNILYIDETWYISMQYITRFILNQGREHIFKYLKEHLDNYLIIVNNINNYYGFTRHDIELGRLLIAKSRIFVENAKMGFLVLKCTYPDYSELTELVKKFCEDIDTLHFGYSPKNQGLSGGNIL